MRYYLYLSTAIISVSLATSGNAWAQCVSTQDCATLGYTESSCPNGKGVKCPFGSKWFCGGDSTTICKQEGFTNACTGAGQLGKGESCANLYKQCDCQSTYKYTCSGTGYSGGSGSACNGKYTACKCATNYVFMFGKTALVNPKKTTLLVKSALYSTPIILAPINSKALKLCSVWLFMKNQPARMVG